MNKSDAKDVSAT